MPPRILVIEDDPDVQDVMSFTLADAGYDVVNASNARSGLRVARDVPLDLVLLDLNLPDLPGRRVAFDLRLEQPHLPIVVVTALDEVERKLHLFEAGANDYLTKPFYPEELLARVRLQLRRKFKALVRLGPLDVNFETREVCWHGQLLALTNKEFDLLGVLVRSPSRVFRPDELIDAVWSGTSMSMNNLGVHVLHLRRKLEAVGGAGVIRTVRGLGYGLDSSGLGDRPFLPA